MNDNQFFDFLSQYMNEDKSQEYGELMQAIKIMSKSAHSFYVENINNGFDKDQAMEITLEYVRAGLTNSN